MGKYARRIPKTIWEHAQVESHLPVVSPFVTPHFPVCHRNLFAQFHTRSGEGHAVLT